MMDTYMNWRMFTNEDNLEGTDRLYNKYLDIFVVNPRTHIKNGRALFTDYEIIVKTNHPEFAIKESTVRRRYSEFVWLKNRLGMNDIMMVTPPSLPGKQYIGRFKDPFLMKRQLGLQSFMNKVVEVNAFLSDPALHLFLQTEYSMSQMDSYLQCGMHLSNIRDRILISVQKNKDLKRRTEDNYQKEFEIINLKSQNIKRTHSVDSIASLDKKDLEKAKFEEGGRGWSRYIGDVINTDNLGEGDYTDFNRDFEVHDPSLAATACVLPGGRLRLASENKEQKVNHETQTHKRSTSWHGHSNDMIDFLLGSYDVIQAPEKDMTITSYSSNGSLLSDQSSVETGDEDFCFDLKEYNIIPMPDELNKENNLNQNDISNNQFYIKEEENVSRWDEHAIPAKWNDVSAQLSGNGFHHSASYSASSDSN